METLSNDEMVEVITKELHTFDLTKWENQKDDLARYLTLAVKYAELDKSLKK